MSRPHDHIIKITDIQIPSMIETIGVDTAQLHRRIHFTHNINRIWQFLNSSILYPPPLRSYGIAKDGNPKYNK